MFKIVIFLIFFPFFYGILLLLKRKPKKAGVILFHHITDKHPLSLSEISMKMFTDYCRTIKSAKWSVKPICQRGNSENELSITFDDGFHSNLKAAEILEEFELKATFFICTAHLTNDEVTDVYGAKARLSEEEILNLHTRGFEIGSHTVHHLDLTLLSDEQLYLELYQSKKKLESIIDAPVKSLSIPYGIWNRKVIHHAKEVGYENIVVYNFTKHADPRERIFPATGVYPFDSTEDLCGKIEGRDKLALLRAAIVPHFAKGSPLAAFSPLYRKLPTPWFMNVKKRKKAYQKENRE